MSDIETAYNLALDYLYSFVDYSLKHSSELAKADFNLDRMRALMVELGNPETKYPIIHVAGTKGKGSVCALAASGLRAAGYRVGLYTSPHLLDYCERIQVNGQPVSHQELSELVEQVRSVVARVPKLTTFEITTAIGFLYFAQQKADAAVIEVGLGGRLDATNVVKPKVSVITSLSYDHMAVLGDTLAKIAGEKAGIIKEGVPVVSAPQKDEALEVLVRIARERNAPLTLVGREVTFKPLSHSLDGQSLMVSGGESDLKFSIPLLGLHQLVNAATAYAALKVSGLEMRDEAIQRGFPEAKWPGRFEILRREPPVVIDSAHNRDSAQRLYQTLKEYFPTWPTIMVFCALEDKDVSGILTELKPCLELVIATHADHPRAPSAEWIAQQVKQVGIPTETVVHPTSALEKALKLAGNRALVLAAGSVAFAGEIRAAWQKIVGCE